MRILNRFSIESLIIHLLFFIVFTSVGGVLLLAFESYSAMSALIFGTFFTLLFYFIWGRKLSFKFSIKVSIYLIPILLFALLLRLNPWHYLEGGQDQGVYTTLSKIYDRTGKVYEKDSLRASVSDEFKALYDEDNHRVIAAQRYNLGESEYLFPFYPVHPIWMSISGFLFGDSMRSFSLTFFSFLSIVGIYLLAGSLFKSQKVGLMSSALLVTLPIHVYFSKLPVTEVLALCIVLFALFFLLEYWKGRKKSGLEIRTFLILSGLLFLVFFFTRISGIVYMPFFFLLSLLSIFFLNKSLQNEVLYYLLGIYFAFLLSLFYYYKVIPYLFWHFYIDYFTKDQLELVTLLALLIPVAVLILYLLRKKLSIVKSLLSYISSNFQVFVKTILFLLFTASLILFYLMGFTDSFNGTVYDLTWFMSNGGISIIKDLAIVSVIAHLSPFLGLPLLYIMFVKKQYTFEEKLLYIFLLLFLSFSVLVTQFVPHHYYFSRYQLIEVIPISIIVISGLLITLIKSQKRLFRIIAYTLLLAYSVYSGLYISVLFLGPSGNDNHIYEVVSENIDTKDDVLFYYDPLGLPQSFVVTPLRHYYGFRTYTLPSWDRIKFEAAKSVLEKSDKAYLLSTVEMKDLKFINEVEYRHMFYASSSVSPDFPLKFRVEGFDFPLCKDFLKPLANYCGGIVPSKYHIGTMKFYLYELKGE